MDAPGTRPLLLWRPRGPRIFGPLQLFQLAAVVRCALWEAYSASTDYLAEFKTEGNKSSDESGGNVRKIKVYAHNLAPVWGDCKFFFGGGGEFP